MECMALPPENPSTFINTSNKMGPCLGSSPGIRRAIVLRPGALPGLRGSHGFVRNRTCLLHHKCSGSQQHFDSLKFFRDDHGLLILVGIPHQLKTDPYLDVDPKFEFVNATQTSYPIWKHTYGGFIHYKQCILGYLYFKKPPYPFFGSELVGTPF